MTLQMISKGYVEPDGYIYDLADPREAYYDPVREKVLRPIRDANALRAINLLRDTFNVVDIEGETVVQKKITFPNTVRVWSSLQVIHQASFIYELYHLLQGLNVNLHDGHPYNLMFDGSQIKWVDLGSLRPMGGDPGSCLREINQYAALAPFYRIAFCRGLRNSPYGTNEDEKMLAHGFAALAEEDLAVSWKEKFYRFRDSEKHRREGTWVGYTPPLTSIEDTLDEGQYAQAVIRVLGAHKVRTMMDIGCNNGRYATVAARRGVEVVALDIEDALICELYEYARAKNLPITPLVADLSLYCWVVDVGPPAFRPVCDMIVAFAVLHHMVHRQDYTFERFFDEISPFQPKTVLLDFIDYSDFYLSQQTHHAWYSIDNFLACAAARGFSHQTEKTANPARRLVVLTRN